MKLLGLLSPLILQKMKEDNISELGDYDAPFCEQQYTHGFCDISLFKFKSFAQFNTPPPQTASNFRHLLSCGTINTIKAEQLMAGKLTTFISKLLINPFGTSIIDQHVRESIKLIGFYHFFPQAE